jgi:predicted DNA-binding transcriptional regulator AlpA
MPDAPLPGWLSAAAAAAYLSCTPAAVRRYARAGRLPKPSYHLGPRSPRWSREQIDSLLHGRQVKDDTEAQFERMIEGIRTRARKAGGRRRKR